MFINIVQGNFFACATTFDVLALYHDGADSFEVIAFLGRFAFVLKIWKTEWVPGVVIILMVVIASEKVVEDVVFFTFFDFAHVVDFNRKLI